MGESAISRETSPGRPQFVVGVGASAGGLEALQRLFEKTQLTGAFAFVVIQHLSPDFESVMGELLAPHTPLKVVRAQHGMHLEADHVYLMPPRHEMAVADGQIRLTERDPGNGSGPHRHPGTWNFGYVLEGTYEVQINDGPLQRLGPGGIFYEAPGALHKISRNGSQNVPVKYLLFSVSDPSKPATVQEP